jgi:hypothetical protein
VFPELHDSEAALAQIADLLVLLYGVVVAQSLEDAVEMCGLPAFPVGNCRFQIADRSAADWAW